MVRYLLISLFLLNNTLYGMRQVRSLQELSYKRCCTLINDKLPPELISQLISLPKNVQEKLSHYLLKADPSRRKHFKWVYQVQESFDLVKTVDLGSPLPFLGKTSWVEKVTLSASGRYAFFAIKPSFKLADYPPLSFSLIIFDLCYNKIVYEEKCDEIVDVVCSPHDLYLAVCIANNSQVETYVYGCENFTKIGETPAKVSSNLTFSKDDSTLYSYHGLNRTVQAVTINKKNMPYRIIDTIPEYDSIQSLAVHPDHNYLFGITIEGKLLIWDLESYTLIKYFEFGNYRGYHAISFDSDGNTCYVHGIRSTVVCNWEFAQEDHSKKEHGLPHAAIRDNEYNLPERAKARVIAGLPVPYAILAFSTDPEPGNDPEIEYDLEIEDEILNLQIEDSILNLQFCLYDFYAGSLGTKHVVGKISLLEEHDVVGTLNKVITSCGDLIFFVHNRAAKGYFFKVQDLKIPLLPLLLMLYFDKHRPSVKSQAITSCENKLLLKLDEPMHTALIQHYLPNTDA